MRIITTHVLAFLIVLGDVGANSNAAELEGGIVVTLNNDPSFSRAIDPVKDSVEIMLMPIVTEKKPTCSRRIPRQA